MIAHLEAPYDNLVVRADTQTEKSKRVVAVSKELETVAFIESIPAGSIFYDVGANVGSYSLIAASRGLRVYAFEPAPFNLERLRANAETNHLDIQILPWAVSNYTGTCSMEWSSVEAGAAEHRMVKGSDIPCWRLDELSPVPEYLKIDVDGHELAVIQGGAGIWPKVQGLQVEIDDSAPGWDLIPRILADSGLRIYAWTRHGTSSISNVLFRR